MSDNVLLRDKAYFEAINRGGESANGCVKPVPELSAEDKLQMTVLLKNAFLLEHEMTVAFEQAAAFGQALIEKYQPGEGCKLDPKTLAFVKK